MFHASAARTNAGIVARTAAVREGEARLEAVRAENRDLRIRLSIATAQRDGAMSTIRHLTEELRGFREVQEFNERNPQIFEVRRGKLTARQILDRFDGVLGVGITDLKGEGRTRNVCRVRQAAAYWMKRRTNQSLPRIGVILNRDHTTIMHACQAHVVRKAERGGYLRPVSGEDPSHG